MKRSLALTGVALTAVLLLASPATAGKRRGAPPEIRSTEIALGSGVGTVQIAAEVARARSVVVEIGEGAAQIRLPLERVEEHGGSTIWAAEATKSVATPTCVPLRYVAQNRAGRDVYRDPEACVFGLVSPGPARPLPTLIWVGG